MSNGNSKNISQHKRMAMGSTPSVANYARGGSVGTQGRVAAPMRKTGTPDTPIEGAKRRNGVPGC